MPRRTPSHDPSRRQSPASAADRDEPTFDDLVDESTVDVELDLVPGNPPVPITTWRIPSSEPGMSLALAERMLIEFSRRGQAVHDATRSAVFTRAVAPVGRRKAATGGRTEAPEPAVLVVCGWPPDRRGLDPAIVLGALRRRLADDGTLVIVGVPGREGFDPGTAVRAATAARLAYLQHVVAVHTLAEAEHLEPVDPPPALAGRDGARHQPVHTDVLVFRQPQHG